MYFATFIISILAITNAYQQPLILSDALDDDRCCVHYQTYEPNTGVDTCGAGDRITGASFAGRSPSVGINGMAAGSQPLIVQTALNILKKGGSAVDAAIAANAVQGLVEPMMNGIGGDLMTIIYNPTDKKLYGYNGSGRSSKTFSYTNMKNTIKTQFDSSYIPSKGPYSITVPGAVQGWCDTHNKFGKLKWNELFEDAIQYATNGYAVTQIISKYWHSEVNGFNSSKTREEVTTNNKYPNAIDGFLQTYTINGEAPEFGQVFKNPALANTYTIIASEGCDAYYRGSLTPKIVNYLQSVGSPLTEKDFNDHTGEWVQPVNTTYRNDYLVSELPPNPQGIATLQMLNMMELYPFGTGATDWHLHSSDYVHASVEIKKLVFADRAKYYADMDYEGVCVPVNTLISKQYAKQRNTLVNMNKAAKYCAPGNINCTLPISNEPIDKYNGDTIYMTTADKDGMMVSWIQSNFGGFGSDLVSSELGFAFQDRGALFSLVNGSSNQYEAGKRPFHTIIPAFMHKKINNEWIAYLSFGVMGGNIQPQGHV
eukprot:487596_1